MTADEFVNALKLAAKGHTFTSPESPFLKEREAAILAWFAIKRRRRKKQDDPVLDLISRYELTGVVLHQFKFVLEPTAYGSEQLVAQQPTYDYYVDSGMILVMYYKESNPGPTGVTSALFLDLLALQASMIAGFPTSTSQEVYDSIMVEYAKEALTITPLAPRFNFFGEERSEFEANKKRYAMKSEQPH